MSRSLLAEIRDHARSYLGDTTDLRAFMDWFSVATWDLPRGVDATTHALVGEILLNWAEMTNGHRTEVDFRDDLARLVGQTGRYVAVDAASD